MAEQKLKIGITQGDINGIGWEVILKVFSDSRMCELVTPIIYGSPKAADFYAKTIKGFEKVNFNRVNSPRDARVDRVNLVVCGDESVKIEPGKESSSTGKCAVVALDAAAKDLKAGIIDALVTGPLNKETAQCDEFKFTGHTEFLADRLGGEAMMIMCSEILRVGLVTTHIPLAEVSKSISKDNITKSLDVLRKTLKQDFGIVEPRIAVLGLNPHSGDGGLLGHEEMEVIKPAIEQAFGRGVLAFGPFAADGFFASASYTKYDAVLAMYHDQGLIPFKTLSPEGVNFTAALSRVRTSPDHGVAFDIAGKGCADAQSMRNAIYSAVDILRNRRNWSSFSKNPLQRAEREKCYKDISVKDLPDTEN